jgi:hypothetical protein
LSRVFPDLEIGGSCPELARSWEGKRERDWQSCGANYGAGKKLGVASGPSQVDAGLARVEWSRLPGSLVVSGIIKAGPRGTRLMSDGD